MLKGAEVFTSAPFSVSRVRLPQMGDERQSLKKEDRSCTPEGVVPVLVVLLYS